jgi:hypothetical protein
MPTSLVSTGVQFPDSTIQTTAASAGTSTLITTVTATASATVNLAFSGSYYAIQIIGTDIYPLSSSRNIEIRYTTNNFSTVNFWSQGQSESYVTGIGDTAIGATQFTNQYLYIPSNEYPGVMVDFMMYMPSSTTAVKSMVGTIACVYEQGGYPKNWSGQYIGYTPSLFTAINGIQFKPTAGNMRGTFKVYGLS